MFCTTPNNTSRVSVYYCSFNQIISFLSAKQTITSPYVIDQRIIKYWRRFKKPDWKIYYLLGHLGKSFKINKIRKATIDYSLHVTSDNNKVTILYKCCVYIKPIQCYIVNLRVKEKKKKKIGNFNFRHDS